MTNASNSTSELRRLGTTDLFVTPVAFGSWPIAGMTSLEVNDADSLATITEAIDCGINFIDTAHCYGTSGESERLIGKAIAGKRDALVLASKGGIHWDDQGVRHYDGNPKRLILECEESLRRMNVEAIDLFYLHAPDPNVPVGESATALAELLKSGKIRSAGASNFSVEQLNEFNAICPITAVQPPYNMLQRDIEADVLPWCQSNKASAIIYWPLMKGLLAGKIRRGHNFDPEDKRLAYEVFQGDKFEAAQRLLDGLDGIAEAIGKTVAQTVVNWTLNQPGITSVLCGAKRDWQIRETALAMGWHLSDKQLETVEGLIAANRIAD
ncbi:MAG: aldo/keto reductase [Mariniblastus sp.]